MKREIITPLCNISSNHISKQDERKCLMFEPVGVTGFLFFFSIQIKMSQTISCSELLPLVQINKLGLFMMAPQ